MFYDERIELEKGRICRTAMVIASALALVSGLFRCAMILVNGYPARLFLLLVPEAVTAVTGPVLLTLGLLGSQGTDERETAGLYLFYNRTAPLYLKLVAGAYAIMLPVSLLLRTGSSYAGAPFSQMLEPLQYLLFLCFFYGFKSRDISFNYSLMESEHYYQGVWRNIGRLVLWLLGAMSLSLVVLALLPTLGSELFYSLTSDTWLSCSLSIASVYLPLMAGWSGMYLLLSFLEQESYRKLSGLSRASGISLVVTVIIYSFYAAMALAINQSTAQDPLANPVLSVYGLRIASGVLAYVKYALLMFLIYFSFEYQRSYPLGSIRLGCSCILVSGVLGRLFGYLYDQSLYVLLPRLLDYRYTELLANITTLRGDLVHLGYFTGGTVVLTALVRQGALPRCHLAAIPAVAGLLGAGLFVRSQGDYRTQAAYISLTVTGVLVYLYILVFRLIRTTEKTLEAP